jgi:hypothetical protein
MELLADSIIRKMPDHWLIRSFKGRTYRYPTS